MSKHKVLILGPHAIEEVLKIAPERFIEVLTTQKHRNDPLHQKLLKQRIPMRYLAKQTLSHIANTESHQSYLAYVKERPFIDLKDFLNQYSKDNGLILMLDSIYDPQNLGAILRSAECFGVDLVVFSKNRGSTITPVVTKTSAGASEIVPICIVSNLAETIPLFQEIGFSAIATHIGKTAKPINQITFPKKSLIIMGSEGEGLRPLLQKKSDMSIYIPMRGHIQSLNVSQAASVVLYHYHVHSHTVTSH